MPQNVNTSEAMASAADKLTNRLADLEGIRTEAKGHLDMLAGSYSAESANEYHEIMFEWDAYFDEITNALDKVVIALGGTAKVVDHTEQDNKDWGTKFAASAESLHLTI